jgi:hypothetical protein
MSGGPETVRPFAEFLQSHPVSSNSQLVPIDQLLPEHTLLRPALALGSFKDGHIRPPPEPSNHDIARATTSEDPGRLAANDPPLDTSRSVAVEQSDCLFPWDDFFPLNGSKSTSSEGHHLPCQTNLSPLRNSPQERLDPFCPEEPRSECPLYLTVRTAAWDFRAVPKVFLSSGKAAKPAGGIRKAEFLLCQPLDMARGQKSLSGADFLSESRKSESCNPIAYLSMHAKLFCLLFFLATASRG